jgi:hypothetical protein
MTKQFITVSLILDALRNERASNTNRMEAHPRFLDWEVGFLVKPKNNSATFQITSTGSGGARLTYQSQVSLVNIEDPEETRSLRGSTLQTGYEFVSRGDVTDPTAKKTTKPMTIATDTIRTFSPRKHSAPGSRIVLKDGTSYAVVEDHDELLARIGQIIAE